MKNIVTVIIPVYNAEKYLEKAVNSVLIQEEVGEIILIEDKSPDNCLVICKRLEEEYDIVKFYQHPDRGNHGAGASRNLGIEKASCEYIAFLDADDYYLPNRFRNDVLILEDNKNIHGIYGKQDTIFYSDLAQQKYKESELESFVTGINRKIESNKLFESLVYHSKEQGYFHLDTFTVRKSMLNRFRIRFVEYLRLHQDTVFILQCAYYMDLVANGLKEPVAIRGVHENNRITGVRNLYLSRQKQYKYLVNWAIDAKISPQITKHFKYNLYSYENYSNFNVIRTFKKIIWLIFRPLYFIHFLKNKVGLTLFNKD